MQKGFPDAEVFETDKVKLNSPIIFAGFVGAGLVGPLSINHIIEQESYFFISEWSILRFSQLGFFVQIFLDN